MCGTTLLSWKITSIELWMMISGYTKLGLMDIHEINVLQSESPGKSYKNPLDQPMQ